MLGIARCEMRCLPKPRRRKCTLTDLTVDERTRLHQLLDICLAAIARIILPTDGDGLQRSFRENNLLDSKIRGAIVDGIKASPRGSKEGRTLRALLCATTRASDVQYLMTACDDGKSDSSGVDSDQHIEGKDNTEEAIEASFGDTALLDPHNNIPDSFFCHVTGCVIDKSGQKGTATGHSCSECNSAVHVLCCERVLQIQIVDNNTPLFCTRCFEWRRQGVSVQQSASNLTTKRKRTSERVEEGIVHLKKRRSGAAGRLYQTSRKDWDSLLCNGKVVEKVRNVKRCSDESIRDALKFLFKPEYIQLLSWGTKRIRVDSKWVSFPAVIRRTSCERIFREYSASQCRTVTYGQSGRTLGRSTFLELAKTFTRGQQKRKAAVDYVLGALVYDTIRTAREIVSNEIHVVDLQRSFLDQLCSVEEFLKFTFLEHIGRDKDAFHDADFALSTYDTSRNVPGESFKSSCKTCLTPFQVLSNIVESMTEENADVVAAIGCIKHNFLLYMGHQHRCFNQEKRIADLFAEIKEDRNREKVVILVDYKMKFEAIRFREKTTEFFGKKGMSWHGAVIFYRENHTELVLTPNGGSQLNESSDRAATEISTLFFDHLLSNDMTQDAVAVCSILDAILSRLRKELPTVKSFYLLSDNARCYQNDIVPVVAPCIAKHHNLSMKGFVHSETQRGKSLVDAHFAIAMKHVSSYCNETKQGVTTPADVVGALNSFGGVANCSAEMVHLRRDHPSVRNWITASARGKLAKLGRVNEFAYTQSDEGKWHVKFYLLSYREFSEYEFGEFYSKQLDSRNIARTIEQSHNNEVEFERFMEEDSYLKLAKPSEIAYQSTVTGVTVWARARLRRQRRRRSIKPQTAIRDAEEGLEQTDGRTRADKPTSDSEGPVMSQCDKCNQLFRIESALEKHRELCVGTSKSSKVIDRAARFAFEMLGTPDAPIYTTKDIHPSTMSLHIHQDIIDECQLRSGWAHRPQYGQTLGTNYVTKYVSELREWFELGEQDKGKKLSASRMREFLHLKYPRRYDIPGEHNITAFISAETRKRKRSKQVAVSRDEGTPVTIRRGMAVEYAGKLSDLLDRDPYLMPRHAKDSLIAALGLCENVLPENFPSENSIKNKLSALKAKRKR